MNGMTVARWDHLWPRVKSSITQISHNHFGHQLVMNLVAYIMYRWTDWGINNLYAYEYDM